MPRMVRQLVVALAAASLSASAPRTASVDLASQLARIPVERSLGGGNLRIVSLYRPEAEALLNSAGRTRPEMLDRLVREMYTPWARSWNGYLGDEAAFRTWANEALFDPSHPVHRTLPLALASILPNELTHQVHGLRPTDPDAGTVLDRTVGEGLATYAAWVHDGRRGCPAAALWYAETEWAWSLAHERELPAAITPIFDSRQRADLDRIASRSEHVLPEAPGAAGYSTGLRIVQAWVARHGDDRWVDLLDLPVRRVLETSGYAP